MGRQPLSGSMFMTAAIATLLAFGCAKPPLAEIAGAEAALQAAREAEAPKFAPEPFGIAENLMSDTYRLNDNKDFENARGKAIETRDKADEARELALRNKAKQGAEAEAAQAVRTETEGVSAERTRAQIESEEIARGAMDEGSMLKSLESVYFAFDDFTIKNSEMPKVEAVRDWLRQNASAKLKIEGHTDERGANDYNLALGARRADSVKQMLLTLGVEASRLTTQSYGEETPADPGHDEAAWAKNRRADFVVSQ